MNAPSKALANLEQRLSGVIDASRANNCRRACVLETSDRSSSIEFVLNTVLHCNADIHHFTTTGRKQYDRETTVWKDESTEESDIPSLLRSAKKLKSGVVIIEDCLAFLSDDHGDQSARVNLADMLMPNGTKGKWIVLIFLEAPGASARLPGMLSDQLLRLSYPYPDLEELIRIARLETASFQHNVQGTAPDLETIKMQSSVLAPALVGLSRSASRNSLRDAFACNGLEYRQVLVQLQEHKTEVLKNELSMQVLDTENAEEPIGLDYAMRDAMMLHERGRMIKEGPNRAKGSIFLGPAGTGKSLFAKYFGVITGLPVVLLQLSSLMNSYLGETERRFAKAFEAMSSLAPLIVLIDEIEKLFGGSSERDGGTMMRCTAMFLNWLSENQKPVYIIGTSNNLKRMGEIGLTLTRSERFDACYFVDVPSLENRYKMLRQFLENKMKNPQLDARKLAEVTEKFSGADLKSLVKQAEARAEYQDKRLTLSLLKKEVEKKRMRVRAMFEEFDELRNWGRIYCEPAGPTDD